MPESNPLAGVLPDGFPSVMVCSVLSLFVQMTVVPRGTLSGEGLYGFVEEGFDAPLTIETVLDCPTALDGRATVVKVNPIVNTIPIEIMLNL
jgi:hypothetical protein